MKCPKGHTSLFLSHFQLRANFPKGLQQIFYYGRPSISCFYRINDKRNWMIIMGLHESTFILGAEMSCLLVAILPNTWTKWALFRGHGMRWRIGIEETVLAIKSEHLNDSLTSPWPPVLLCLWVFFAWGSVSSRRNSQVMKQEVDERQLPPDDNISERVLSIYQYDASYHGD